MTSEISRCGASLLGSDATKEFADLLGHPGALLLRHAREDRQRQHFAGEPLGYGKVPRAVAEGAVCSAQVRRFRIVEACSDATLAQESGKLIARFRPHDIEVPDRLAAGRDRR